MSYTVRGQIQILIKEVQFDVSKYYVLKTLDGTTEFLMLHPNALR